MENLNFDKILSGLAIKCKHFWKNNDYREAKSNIINIIQCDICFSKCFYCISSILYNNRLFIEKLEKLNLFILLELVLKDKDISSFISHIFGDIEPRIYNKLDVNISGCNVMDKIIIADISKNYKYYKSRVIVMEYMLYIILKKSIIEDVIFSEAIKDISNDEIIFGVAEELKNQPKIYFSMDDINYYDNI